MKLAENIEHVVTVAGAHLLAEARSGAVNVTGWRLLDAPEVDMMPDGSVVLRIAVPDQPRKRAKAAEPEQASTEVTDGEI